MGRLLLGILKGGVVGAAIGYLASRAGIASGAIAIIVYGVIGAAVGLVCGRPLWRQDTLWTPILKAIFGFGLGVGAAFAARKWLGGVHVPLSFVPGSDARPVSEVPALLGTAVGVLYGIFVELDDAAGASESPKPKS